MALRLSWCASLRTPDFPAADYEALRQRLPGSTPFNHLGWLRAAEAALGPEQQLQVLLGYQGERLCLCLPLVRAREPFGPLHAPVVRHLGYPLADRIALLIDLPTIHAGRVLAAIRQRLPHALMQLSEVPVAGEDWLREWAGQSSTFERRLTCQVPVHRISEADHQEVSGDPRYKLRRARKRINACGARIRRVLATADTIQALLDAVSAVEALSWKGDDEVGIFSGAQHRQWIYQGFTALAAEGLVCAVLLELDGRCISYRLGLLERGRVYDYNLAFVPEHRDLGSGRVLLEEYIHWGLEQGWDWVDASRVSLANSSHQLHERMTGCIEQWRLSCYSWRPDGMLLGYALRAWRWLRSRRDKNTSARHNDAPDSQQESPNAIPGHSQR
ncbi:MULTISPECIES: GNAT family N-acetyltransferase [unclassified Pseudomonas]|uniref:GNAT family N-acetyltransferase n=1 Tax=unclassified Pseudomonas TaxID=196821 RepID=UPI0021BB819E|nr:MULTISPECIES: GNAT family N-acetyltransferase [unclassified Pseudomonas]MCT8163366.1 GNAT family N-acetyltransferase [Pseudomonas sp. HD6422]MCT8182294.1 GNAT family N-acetyltransferase [Pseudomonas sp. HD6421]